MFTTVMPGASYQGTLPALSANERETASRLKAHVAAVAGSIGERHTGVPDRLDKTAAYIEKALAASGYRTQRQEYAAHGVTVANIEAERTGSHQPQEILVIGAHYDTIAGSPGANDNASGVAALLEMARLLAATPSKRSIRFVAFVNEEPPFFMGDLMGSTVYARRCKTRGEHIAGMISLETVGYYSDAKGSQRYPFPLNLLYPDTGNFLAFVGNSASADWVKQTIGLFRQHARFPSEGGAVPEAITGIGWSDHWSFWQQGYPALMVTDSAPYRYPHYHSAVDTPDKLDYERMAQAVFGLYRTIEALGNK